MAAGDVDEAARLVAELSRPGDREERLTMLQRWYRWLDEQDGIERHPMVAVWAAFLALETGQAGRGRTMGRRGRRRWGGRPWVGRRWVRRRWGGRAGAADAWAAVLRASMCRHGVRRMRADADEAARKLAAAGIATPAAMYLQGIARAQTVTPQAARRTWSRRSAPRRMRARARSS